MDRTARVQPGAGDNTAPRIALRHRIIAVLLAACIVAAAAWGAWWEQIGGYDPGPDAAAVRAAAVRADAAQTLPRRHDQVAPVACGDLG